MNKITKKLLTIAAFFLITTAAFGGSNTLIGIVPPQGTNYTPLTYKMWIAARSGDLTAANCAYSPTNYTYYSTDAADFSPNWSAGETVVAITEKDDGRYSVTNLTLANQVKQNFPNATLQAIPTPSAAAAGASIAITWAAAIDSGTGNVAGYNVYRDTAANGNLATKITGSPVAGTSYTDSTGAPGTTYYYKIKIVFRGSPNTMESTYFSAASNGVAFPINHAPVLSAIPDKTVASGSALTFALSASDVDGDTLTYASVNLPLGASLNGANFSWTPKPDNSQVGPLTINFTVTDTHGATDSQSAQITVTKINHAPVANNQNISLDEDTRANITLVATDQDAGDILSWTVGSPAHGTLSGAAPNLVYSPAANFNGSDSFTFKINDGTIDSNTATVNITINSVNDAPVLSAIPNKSVASGNALNFTLLATDVDLGDVLTFSVVGLPAGATFNSNTGSFAWTPAADNSQVGTYNVTFMVSDGHGGTDSQSAQITVTKLDNAPVANSQNVMTNEDTSLAITLNGSDTDNDPLSYAVVAGPAHGILSGAAPNLVYLPAANYNGSDSFTFKINDGTIDSNTATVNITVNAVNAVPVTLSSIAVTPSNPTITAGQNQQFTATGTYSDNSTQVITNQVNWTSSDLAKATIDAKGLATSVAQGTTNITASLNNVTSPIQTLTVNAVPAVKAEVMPAKLSVLPTEKINIIINYKDANNGPAGTQTVQWTAPARVGQYDISASLGVQQGITITGNTLITVVAGPAAVVNIGDLPTSVVAGTNVTLSASAADAWANPVSAQSVVWSASSGSLLNGSILTDLTRTGDAIITANLNGISTNKTITVTPSALARAAITPTSASIAQGDNVSFTAKGYDAYGNETGDALSFISALGNSSTITANVPAGKYVMTASKGKISAKADVIVAPKYSDLKVVIDGGKVNLSAKDALGNSYPLSSKDYGQVIYDLEGKDAGNLVNSDGTVVEGEKEGAYVLTAKVIVGDATLLATTLVNVNKGAPKMAIKVDDQSLGNNIVISRRPKFSISASDGNGVKAVRVTIDGKEMSGLSLTAQSVDNSAVTASFTPMADLVDGSHSVVIEAEDSLGTKVSINAIGVKVYSALQVVGTPVNYPNPFKPSYGQSTTINFKLSQAAADLKLSIYNLAGQLVYARAFSGVVGENELAWDGKNSMGELSGNGAYLYFISENGKVLGKGAIAVYD